MGAANTLLEVMQLSRQIPVTHVGQPRGLRRPDTLAGSAVTGRAGRVERLASVRISRKRGSRALIGQRIDIGDAVVYCRVVSQRRSHRYHLLCIDVLIACPADTLLEMPQLRGQVPACLAAQLRGVERLITLRLGPMTGAAHDIEGLACRSIARDLGSRLGVSWLIGQPCLKRILLIHHYAATHGEMRQPTQLLAKHVELPGPGGSDPEISDHARDHIHLDAELRHGPLVIDVLGAQQHLDRLVDGQMQLGTRYQDVVCAPGIVWIDAERVVRSDEPGISAAQYSVTPGKTVTPCTLLTYHFYHLGPFGYGDELGPYKQTRCQHRSDADRRQYREPPLELFILGRVLRPSSLAVTVQEDRTGHEQVDGHKDDPGDHEGDVHRVIHHLPIGCDRREPPRAQEVEQDRSNDQ